MEVAVLTQSKETSQDASAELVAMHRPAYALAIRLVGSREDAEDVVQQAYLRACGSLRHGSPPDNACTWFLKVVANEAKCHLRGSARRARRMAKVRTMSGGGGSADASRLAEQGELVSALRSAVEGLEPENRALVSLCCEQGYSQRDAAEVLDIPLSTLSDRLGRILEELRSSLGRAGFTVPPAVILGALAHTLPPVPVGLAAKVGSLVYGNATGGSTAGGTTVAAVKGGLAMKVILGIAAAGALAAGAATVDLVARHSEPRDLGAAPAITGSVQGAPKWQLYAFASDIDCLDGPNLEALGSGHGALPTTDSEGNVYFICKYSTCRIRCLRADGQTETIAGDDRWPGSLKLAEGPAAYLPNRFMGPSAGNFCRPGALLTVYGLPLKGEEQGRIYFHWQGQSPIKIYRNKDKGNRWWMKQVGTPGKPKPPTTVGQTVKLQDVDLTGAKIRSGMIAWEGNVYTFDEPKGEMTCSFTLAEYEPKILEFLKRPGKPVGPPEHYIRTDDGSVYLCYYWRTYDIQGQVFRMSPDRKKFEHIIADVTDKELRQKLRSSNFDGNGLLTTWHCGPADISFTGNTLLTHSIDSTVIRRWKDGRVSSLCRDGEWRENPGRTGGGAITAGYYQAGHGGDNYIYINSTGETGNTQVHRLGPVDFAKPTVGPLQEDPREVKKEEGGPK